MPPIITVGLLHFTLETAISKTAKHMENINQTLDLSAEIIKKWGETEVFKGVKLSEYLTINEIKFWDIFAVEIARIYLPELVQANKKNSTYRSLKIFILSLKVKCQIYITLTIANFRRENNSINSSSNDLKSNILFLGFQRYIYIDTLEPIISSIKNSNLRYSPILISDHCFKISDQLLEINRININNHFTRDLASKYKNILSMIDEKILFIKKEKIFDKLKDDRLECNRAELTAIFKRLLLVEMPKIAYQALLAEHLVKRTSPAVIVSPDVADPRNRIFINLGKSNDIPTLEIQFGLTQDEGIEWRFCNSDYIAAWGESSRQALLKHGVNSNSIKITGSPRHDKLSGSPPKINISTANYITVLIASTYNLTSYREFYRPAALFEMLQSAIDNVSAYANLKLIIKPHPREDDNKIKNFVGRKDNIIFVSKDSDIRDHIRDCDVFISFGTTATADAIIADKIVICPVFDGWIWSEIFTSTGAVVVVDDVQSLHNIIEKISKGNYSSSDEIVSSREEFIKNYAFAADGNSSYRVMKLIEYMDKSREGLNKSV